LTPIRVGAHDAIRGAFAGLCGITFSLTDTARVDVTAADIAGDDNRACQVAMQIAELVEPKLPN